MIDISKVAEILSILSTIVICVIYANNAKNKADNAMTSFMETRAQILLDKKDLDKRIDTLVNDLKEVRNKHEALDNKIVDKLSSIEKAIAKIQVKLEINES